MMCRNIDAPGLAGGLIVCMSYVRIQIALPCLCVIFAASFPKNTCAVTQLHPHSCTVTIYNWMYIENVADKLINGNKTHMYAKAWCIYSDRAYIQSEVHTHCYSVLIHLLEPEYTGTSSSSWCSCPPLTPHRWWCEGEQCVLGWWMGLLSLPQSQ